MEKVLVSCSKKKIPSGVLLLLPAVGEHADAPRVPSNAAIVNESDTGADVLADLVSSDPIAGVAVVNVPRGFKSMYAESGMKADAAAEEGQGHFTVALSAVRAEPVKAATK